MNNRIRIAWHVLRGRPVCYRMTFVDGFELVPGTRNALILENSIVSREFANDWKIQP